MTSSTFFSTKWSKWCQKTVLLAPEPEIAVRFKNEKWQWQREWTASLTMISSLFSTSAGKVLVIFACSVLVCRQVSYLYDTRDVVGGSTSSCTSCQGSPRTTLVSYQRLRTLNHVSLAKKEISANISTNSNNEATVQKKRNKLPHIRDGEEKVRTWRHKVHTRSFKSNTLCSWLAFLKICTLILPFQCAHARLHVRAWSHSTRNA